MKRHGHLLKYSISGCIIATVLSLAYLFFGSWGWFEVPDHLWAQILFFPGIVVGHFFYEHFSTSIPICKTVGVATMSIVGGIIGFVLHILIHRRQITKTDDKMGSA